MIYADTVDLGITFGQPSLNVCDSLITALSHARRYSNARIFPSEDDSRQVVVVGFAAQGIYNHICLTRVIMNLEIIVLDQLQPSSLTHVQINLSENVLQALVVS
jgi:hypothetical protein